MSEEIPQEEKKKEKISDFDTVSINPSAKNMKSIAKMQNREPKKDTYEVTNIHTGETENRDLDTGEYVYNGFTYKDNASFTKLFRGVESEIPRLKTNSIQVLMYVISELKSGSDVIKIDAVEVSNVLGYKNKRSVYDGIFGLLVEEFLYRKTGAGGEYFINVGKIFRGNRIGIMISREEKKKQ